METINVNRDSGDYFALMNAYLLAQVATLDGTLVANGVTDSAVRETICAQFGLSMGIVLDCGWISANQRKYHPLLMFSERFLNNHTTRLSDVGEIFATPKTDEFHPLAVDAATVFFRDLGADNSKVRYGSVGEA